MDALEGKLSWIFLGLIVITAMAIVGITYFLLKPQDLHPELKEMRVALKKNEPFPTHPTRIVKHRINGYEVWEIYNVFTHEECEHIKALAYKQGLTTSEVISYGTAADTAVDTNFRKSKQAWLTDSTDPLLEKFAQYTARVTGFPEENQEMAQVVRYDEGGQFHEHWDACVGDDKALCERMNRGAGQRQATLLVYLNDDFKGGETHFPKIGITVRPEVGKGLLFWDARPDDSIIDDSLHTGKPVEKGNKWIVTKWVHARAYDEQR